MTDFAANVHFRTVTSSSTRLEGVVGGYGWFFGRFATWEEFRARLDGQLARLGYQFLGFENVLEITQRTELNEGEQRQLYDNLDLNPMQSAQFTCIDRMMPNIGCVYKHIL